MIALWLGCCCEGLEEEGNSPVFCELQPGHKGVHVATVNSGWDNIEQVMWE